MPAGLGWGERGDHSHLNVIIPTGIPPSFCCNATTLRYSDQRERVVDIHLSLGEERAKKKEPSQTG